MSKKTLVEDICRNIENTLMQLRKNNLIRDENGISQKKIGKNLYTITFSGKSSINTVMFDKHVEISHIINLLLSEYQYNVLLYDKSIIQAEFTIENNNIIKERLIFIKKHNKVWDLKEINKAENNDEDWFNEEEGIPTFIRIDFDPANHIECNHPSIHMTISNNESCRISIKSIISFSSFVRFILFHFYGINLKFPKLQFEQEEKITNKEKKMFHINWTI